MKISAGECSFRCCLKPQLALQKSVPHSDVWNCALLVYITVFETLFSICNRMHGNAKWPFIQQSKHVIETNSTLVYSSGSKSLEITYKIHSSSFFIETNRDTCKFRWRRKTRFWLIHDFNKKWIPCRLNYNDLIKYYQKHLFKFILVTL